MNKAWYTSKTIWAGVFGTVVTVAGLLLHVSVSDAQVQELATDAATIGGAIASVVAIYGRIKASMPISGTQAAQQIQPAVQKGQ